jgi:hypothetical protein
MGEVQVRDAHASSEPDCSRDQEQSCPYDDGSDGSRDALTGRCETLDGDGCRHDSHRAKVHDPDDQEDRHQTETAVGQWRPRRRPCRQAVPASAGSVQPRSGAFRQKAR